MKTSLLLALCLLSSSILASLGRPLQNDLIPAGVCLITLEKSDSGEQFHCTGSLISTAHIKTAGHCLEQSKVIQVNCREQERSRFKEVQRFSAYNHRLLQREETNRWFDQAIIHLEKEILLPTLELVKERARLEKILPSFEACAIAGYGLSETHSAQTGHLKGVLVPPQTLNIRDQLIYAEGQYLYELLPGDSGSGLICYSQGKWFDLGTASAHDWDHNSLFAPNFLAKTLFNQFVLKSFSPSNSTGLRMETSHQNSLSLEGELYLLPYSKIKTTGGIRYNGDLEGLRVEILDILSQTEVLARIRVNQSSRFFLCEEEFLCYGTLTEGIISINDLTQK